MKQSKKITSLATGKLTVNNFPQQEMSPENTKLLVAELRPTREGYSTPPSPLTGGEGLTATRQTPSPISAFYSLSFGPSYRTTVEPGPSDPCYV